MSAHSEGAPGKFFAVKVTKSQEMNVALLLENRAKAEGLPVYAIISPPKPGGFVVVETSAPSYVDKLVRDLRHARRRMRGMLSQSEIELMVKPKPTVEVFAPGMEAEIIAGPFKGSRGKVVDVVPSRNEVVLMLYEASYPLKVTVPADYVKPVSPAGGQR